MSLRGMTRFKMWLAVLAVFVLGCVTGASLDSVYRLRARDGERPGAHGRHGNDDIFENMKRDLNLSEQQATEIRAILEQTRNEYRNLRSEVHPRYETVRQNARARIRTLLTPEQQKLFDVKTAEHDAKREGDEK